MRQAPTVVLSRDERDELEAWVRGASPSDRRAVRARVILEAAAGRTNGEIARTLGIHPETVSRWRHRFVVNRLEGVRRDAPRSGARSRVPPSVTERILKVTLEETPPDGVRWTTRSLARALQVNHMLVHRVWRAYGLSPSRAVSTATALTGPPWVDLVGVYAEAPATVAVFAVGTRVLPAGITRAPLPAGPDISGGYLLPELPATPSTLVALLGRFEEPSPQVVDTRRSSSELLVFLRSLEENAPPGTTLEAFFDRALEQLSERVRGWLAANPRFHVRTTPAGGSWTRSIETWINGFRSTSLHPESFRGVSALSAARGLPGGEPGLTRKRFSWTFSPRPPPTRDLGSPSGLQGRRPSRRPKPDRSERA